MIKRPTFRARALVAALTLAATCWLAWTSAVPAAAQPPGTAPAPDTAPPQRELFVPFEELSVLLGGDTRRVFMTRAEYAELLAKAKHAPEEALPQETAILSAEYQAVLETGRAELSGKLKIEVFGDGLHGVPLAISGVGIRSAELDGEPAALAEGPGGAVLLLVEGRGQYDLQLDMVLPLSTAAAEQSLSWQVPVPPATTFEVTAAGDVEMKSGAAILSRRVDTDAGVTHFELLPSSGQMNLVMSLNNRRLRDQTTVLARGVLVDELTQGYERLHASFSMNVLHGAADEFRIAIPADFEVTQVATPLLARWSVEDDQDNEGKKILEIKLRELTTERVLINVRADRAAPELDDWQMPKFIPLDVAGFAGVVGILLEDQLTSGEIQTQGLIPIDNQVLTAALPPSVLTAEAGMPRVRPLATYYAPQADFAVQTDLAREPAQLYATTNLLLTLTERGLEVDGGFALLPEREKLFSFEFHVPQEWSVDTVRTAEGAALAFERYAEDDGTRVRVQLPAGLAPRATLNVLFHASYSPANWLGDWEEQTLDLPAIAINREAGTHESGAIAVRAVDDLRVRPAATSGLIVLTDSEKGKYGYSDVATNVAWRYTEEAWQGSLSVTRTTPRLTGRALSFFQISPEALTAHFELIYNVDQARTQRVSFSLPENTPAEVAVRGLDDALVRETSSQVIDGRRQWDVQLAEKRTGRIRLSVDFMQPLAEASYSGYVLPQIRTENVAYQSGLVAVEGSPEIDVSVVQHSRSVDMGELVDATYQVGKRLLGVYSYVGTADQTSVDVVRRTVHALPTTIVQRADLVTLVAGGGVGQTAARFALRTKALYLEVRLPEGATLWSVMLDGQPALPERQAEQIVIALPAAPENRIRDLQVIYEQPIDRLLLRAHLDLLAPTLWQRTERDATSEPIPLADLHWELVLPPGYRLADVGGTVSQTNATERFRWQQWLEWLVELGGGRVEASKTSMPSVGQTEGARLKIPQEIRLEDMQKFEKSAPSLPPGASPTPSTRAPQRDGSELAEGLGMRSSASASLDTADALSVSPFGGETETVAGLAEQAPVAQPPMTGAAINQPAADRAPMSARMSEGNQRGVPAKGDAKGARVQSAWALGGMRSLAIDLSAAKFGESVTFTSLGVDPNLRATLIDQRRWQWLGLACGLAVFTLGLWRVSNTVAARLRYVGMIVVVTLLLPPLTGWEVELEPVVQAVILAALALLAVTIIGSLGRALTARAARWTRSRAARAANAAATTTALVAGLLLGNARSLEAQDAAVQGPGGPVTVTNLTELEALIRSLHVPGPVSIPADAIVIPYDPAAPDPVASAEKLLVPYDQYASLWNAAHPDRLLTPKPPVAAYAWSSAQYHAVLEGDSDLRLTGSLNIHVFADGDVAVPLAISGGVLQRVTVDGQPARLQVVEAQAANQGPVPAAAEQAVDQQLALAALQARPESLFLLHLDGKGRKRLAIEVRLKIEKRGGWRVIDGRLPAAPGTELSLEVPEAKTEVRFQGFADRAALETDEANETVETALPASGRVQLQWRAKIAEAEIDQGLSVEAQAVFDVQEDGLKFAWHGTFDFRRGRRESFTLLVPGDYLIEKVVGSNVRGWNTEPVGEQQQLTVDLLTTVSERETLTLFLLRAYTAEPDEAATIEVPVVRVPDAMLQQGQVAVRRSSLLELRTNKSAGLTRIDTPDDSQWLKAPIDASPLPLKPFQAFRYSQVPYTLELLAEPSTARVRVTAQSLLKLSQLESTLESRLILQIAQRAVHHVRISVPANWKLDPPQAPVGYEWNVAPEDDQQPGMAGQRWVDIYFANGVIGEMPLVLRGKLEQSLAAENAGAIPVVPLPRIAVEDVAEQVGDIVVTSDPAFDVRAEQLQNCETALLGSAEGWLAAEQRTLARLLVHHTGNDYSGQLRITRRAPQVTAFSVTNVKVTDRSVEETIFLEFTIRSAGIRQISIVVPAALARTRVRGPLVREQTWTQVGSENDSPWRLVVDLQEDVMGQYSLILEHDRLPANGEQAVPIPVIETGVTEHRFVTLENSGRDELLVAQRSALEPLERSQAQWRLLSTLLGGKATEAFVVRENAETPRLTYTTRERAAVETVGARIGIARTLMVVDDNGVYRAVQEYRVENRTEQYLEIELPEGARLWTVMVAGEPVKPMTALAGSSDGNATASSDSATSSTSAGGQRLRIPLAKTAAGDLDYVVTIKYGGQMPRPGAMRITRFPLVRTVNINVELSQVRLRLPETDRWFNFGGSMGRVLKPEELEAGWLSFRTRQLNELTELLSRSDDNDFSKARATNNLKQLGKEIQQYRNRSDVAQTESEELKAQLAYNSAAWSDAEKQLQKPEAQLSEALAQPTNRELLNQRFAQQGNERSYNVASEKGDNFKQTEQPAGQQPASSSGEFDAQWLAGNSLQNGQALEQFNKSWEMAGNKPSEQAMPQTAEGRLGGVAQQQAAAQPEAPKLFAPADAEDGRKRASAENRQAEEDRVGQVYRYQQRLEQQQAPEAKSRQGGAEYAAPGLAFDMPRTAPKDDSGSMMGSGGAVAPGGMGGMPGMPGMPGMGGSMAAGGGAIQSYAVPAATEPSPSPIAGPGDGAGPQPVAAPPGYLTSLDVELPMRGVEYMFTTPRGQTEITAQSISQESISRLSMIAITIAVALLVWTLARIVSRARHSRFARLATSAGLILLGLALLLTGTTPLYALFALVSAIAILIRR